MADIISPERRSALMSRIRGKNTKIELEVRSGLHALGFRYRLGGAGLPGRPDIVLPKHRTVVFVHGCFWHQHDCYLFRLPKTRTEFWKAKADGNRARDREVASELKAQGWNVETLWECQLRGLSTEAREDAIMALANSIRTRGERMSVQPGLDFASGSMVSETAADGSPLWWKIQSLTGESDELFVKKLSRNDTSWADYSGKHQAGFYIPRPIREARFFPELQADNPTKPHIFHAELAVLWPQTGEVTSSHMRHYSNKGPETHFTVLPKTLFQGLTPASLLLIGRFAQPVADCNYWIVVLDSVSEEAELLETVLDLESGFHYGRFEPSRFEDASRLARDETQELIERLQSAISTGTLAGLLAEYADIPDPTSIATTARNEWLRTNGFAALDPWAIPNPGDAIMEISRDIEFRHYKRYELRRRAAELVSLLAGSGDLVTAVVKRFPEIDRIFLSASQQRKTRAGRSFEHHIAASLKAGRVRFVEQAVTGGRRPDFVMPDLPALRSRKRAYGDALVVAAKTTLRERWKQVTSEKFNCDVLLATVDDRVALASIREMAESGIRLVVPEALKTNDEAHYKGQPNVMSFREFFDNEIRGIRPFLLLGME